MQFRIPQKFEIVKKGFLCIFLFTEKGSTAMPRCCLTLQARFSSHSSASIFGSSSAIFSFENWQVPTAL